MIEEFDPYLVEDPVQTDSFLQDIPKLRSLTSVPLAAGEEWGARWDFHKLVENHDLDFVRCSLPNVGGITELIRVCALCETHDIGIVPHFTGPIATAAQIHALGPYPQSVVFEYNYGTQPIAYLNEFLTFKEGKLYANDRPGLGVTVNMDRLKLVAQHHRTRAEPADVLPARRLTDHVVGALTDVSELHRRRMGRRRPDAGQHQPVRHRRHHRPVRGCESGTGDRGDQRCGGGLRCMVVDNPAAARRRPRSHRLGNPGASDASLAICWRVKRARPRPRRAAKSGAPVRSSSSSPARRCGPPASDPLGAARRDGGRHARADWRGRAHHAVEFSDRDSVLEDRPCPGLREHRRVQAGGSDPRAAPGRWQRSSAARACPRRVQPRHGTRVGDRRGARQRSRVARRQLHRVDCDRHRIAQACAARLARVSSRWAARTRSSSSTTPTSNRGECRGPGRVLLRRPAVHRLVSVDRHGRHSRPIRGGGRCANDAPHDR